MKDYPVKPGDYRRRTAAFPQRRSRPKMCHHSPLKAERAQATLERGRRESRVLAAPAASCVEWKTHELVTTGAPKQSGLPCATVLTAYSALSPVTGLYCHRPPCDTQYHHELDASVGSSEPLGFAVHETSFVRIRERMLRCLASIASHRKRS